MGLMKSQKKLANLQKKVKIFEIFQKCRLFIIRNDFFQKFNYDESTT